MPTSMAGSGIILALDVGEKRIGVASAYSSVGIASPLQTLDNPSTFIIDIVDLCSQYNAIAVVIGLPRGLDGQETSQTSYVRVFAGRLSEALLSNNMDTPLYWVDEALTSVKAKTELQSRNKSYSKGDIDSLAATYILEDYFSQPDVQYVEEYISHG